MKPSIFKVMDISTSHITQEDVQMLEDNIEDLSAYKLEEFGWLCYVGELTDNWNNDIQWSIAFHNVLRKAANCGCDYVRFDRDGSEYDDLPTFDWE